MAQGSIAGTGLLQLSGHKEGPRELANEKARL